VKDKPNPFWDFSIDLYPQEGVKPACLALQTSMGVDVNILLVCYWLGAHKRTPLTADDMAGILAYVDPWHQMIVKGLREVRQRLKSGFPPVSSQQSKALRQEILRTDLQAEKIEQVLLFDLLSDHPATSSMTGREIAASNLQLYLSAIGVQATDNDQSHLRTILERVFPETDP